MKKKRKVERSHQVGRDRKKHRGVKLNEQKRNVMIGLQERVSEYEDLERL